MWVAVSGDVNRAEGLIIEGGGANYGKLSSWARQVLHNVHIALMNQNRHWFWRWGTWGPESATYNEVTLEKPFNLTLRLLICKMGMLATPVFSLPRQIRTGYIVCRLQNENVELFIPEWLRISRQWRQSKCTCGVLCDPTGRMCRKPIPHKTEIMTKRKAM